MNEKTRPRSGRITLWLLVPLTIALNIWMMYGPTAYAEAGWLFVGALFLVTPALLVWQAAVMLLALLPPRRPKGFTARQTVVIWCAWLCMALYGATATDAGDSPPPDRASVVEHLLGTSTGGLAALAFLIGSVCASTAVVLLLVERARVGGAHPPMTAGGR